MAKIRKRIWRNKSGTHFCYEINYVIDGKSYRKSGYKSKIDAQLDLPNVLKETKTKGNIKFEELADLYINRHCELNCKPATKTLYKQYIERYTQTICNKLIKDIKKRDIEQIILILKTRGLTNKTINCVIVFIQAVFNYGIDNEYIDTSPIRRYKKLPQVKPPIRFLNEIQMKVFLELAKKSKYYVFFVTALYTGMRVSEIAGLEWSDIDFKNRKINVDKQIYRGITITTKTNKSRIIDIPISLIDALKEHKQNNTYLSKLVFHNGCGEPVHTCSMKEHFFHTLIAQCNQVLDADNQITNFRFHDLRHTYATFLLSNGVPVKYVQEQLGHSSAKMTMDVYASVMPSVKFGAMDILNNVSENKKIEHKLSTKN